MFEVGPPWLSSTYLYIDTESTKACFFLTWMDWLGTLSGAKHPAISQFVGK